MTGSRRRSARALLVTGAVLTTMALGACGREVAGPGAGADLPVLRIGTQPVNDGATGIGAEAFPLKGNLPAAPESALVYRFADAPAPESGIRALATALGVTAAPVRHDHGWELSGSGGLLRVRDGGAQEWSFSRTSSECPVYAVDVDSADPTSVSSCAVGAPASPGSSPRPGSSLSPVPSDDEVRTAVAPVLAALGLPAADTRVAGGAGSLRTVVVDPRIEAHPTVGARTVIDVDTFGVAGALGHLATPVAGTAYPLVPASVALDRLRSQPRPALAIACPQPSDGKPQACPAGPSVITGAVLGLQLRDEGGSALLVPAWLFTVEGSDEKVGVVAVADRYLADPSAPDTGGSAAPGSSGGSEPGSGAATPIPPSDLPLPLPNPSAPAAGTSAVTAVAVSADGRTLTLTGWGGVCATYAGQAVESPSEIEVAILATPTIGPDMGCIDLAKEITVDVRLQAPVGTRTVVDAVSGAVLPTR